MIIIIHSFSIALFSDPKKLNIKHEEEGDENQGGQADDSATEARWSVIVDRDKGGYG